jgi:glycosyltransferase involved in cell wall biosynthesis
MGQYASALLRWVPEVASIDVVAYGAPEEERPGWLPTTVEWRVPGPARLPRLAAIQSRLRWLPRAAVADGIDVFHAPGVHVRPSFPPVAVVNCPLVATIHDVIPLSYYGRTLPLRNRAFYVWNLRRAAAAQRTLTVSSAAKVDIARYASIATSRIEVVSSAVDFHPNPDRTPLLERGITGPYILYAGSFEPRKNLVGMLHAFERFSAAGGPHSLAAITERASGHSASVAATLGALACRSRVHLLHSVPDAEVRALYTHASAVVFPSLSEGLGLPPIQAAACGVPVVVSDLPVFRETVGEIAVVARPGDTDSLCGALVRATTDPEVRAAAAARGPAIAARYAPWRGAAQHAEIYSSCQEGRHAAT